ncbi:MAG: D-sedoheptulose 7-phosphate isomerase [Candidatus Omnitrophica bacterium]|nr:D-sedoheptulose 7-phosphate isomerase [Candidatus Omnitrophota bacterium]
MANKIKKMIKANQEVVGKLLSEENLDAITTAAEGIISALKKGGKVLVFGNGGSAADSQHMVAELVGRFKKERKGIPAIALTANTSTITALSNDYGYEVTFARQIEALAKKGDVAIGISTSGTAKNVIAAVERSKEMGLLTIGLTGKGGGKIKAIADLSIVVKSDDTPRIQEAHILVIHILCELVEDKWVS